MGGSGSAAEQSPEEIYRLVAEAAVQHRPIAALYDGTRRLLCPHVVGSNQPGEWRVFCYQYGKRPKADHCRAAMRGSGAAFR
jgi:hypothetical protein